MKRNLIPIVEIGPVIGELIAERWPYGGGQAILAEKIGCDESTIWQIANGEKPYGEFDLIDRILCALGRFDHWYGRFEHIYPTKFMETCLNPMCNRKFPERGGGARRRRYCGRKCRQLHHLIKQGKATGMKAAGRCHKGHRLTPDNIIRRPDGKRECRECSTANRRHRYATDPVYRARAAESRRRWAAKRAA